MKGITNIDWLLFGKMPRPHDQIVNSLVLGADKTYAALVTSQTWIDDASYTCDTHERCWFWAVGLWMLDVSFFAAR